MSTAPSNGKTAQTIATKGRVDPGSIDKPGSLDKPGSNPAAKAKPKMSAEQQKHYVVMGIAIAVVLGVGASMFFYFHKPATGGEARLNDPPEKIIQFISTNEFDKLDFDRKKLWMMQLAGKKREVLEMEQSGKLSRKQLEDVLAIVWLGKQFKHSEKYNSLGDLDRKDMLDGILDDNEKDKLTKKKGDPEPDKKRVKELEETFPGYERNQITGFRQALKDREKERKNEAHKIRKGTPPARGATRPTSRPGERPDTAAPAAHPATPK